MHAVNRLPLFHLGLFLRISPVILFGICFLSPHLGYLFIFVSVYWVDLLCLPVLEWRPYVVCVLWGLEVQYSWSPDVGAPRMPLLWVIWTLLFWLSLDFCCPVLGWGCPSLRLAEHKDQPQPQYTSCSVSAYPMKQNSSPALSGDCPDLSSGVTLVGLIGSHSNIVWILPRGFLVLAHLGRDSCAGQWQAPPVTNPGLRIPAWSYKWSTVCGCLCWSWVYVGVVKRCTVWFPPAPRPRAGWQKAWSNWIFTFSCWLLVRLCHWKSLWR